MFSGLKGGRKRVSWTKIKESNEWYISEDFLLPGRVFFDPGRMLEADLDRYWTHWYKKAKEGPGFTFKTAEPPRMKVNDGGGEGQPDDQGNPKEQSKAKVGGGKGKERATGDHGDSSEEESTSVESDKAQSPGVLTPDQCASDGDKLSFLRALCVEEVDYQFLINLVAQFRVSSLYVCATYIQLTGGHLVWQQFWRDQVASSLLFLGPEESLLRQITSCAGNR